MRKRDTGQSWAPGRFFPALQTVHKTNRNSLCDACHMRKLSARSIVYIIRLRRGAVMSARGLCHRLKTFHIYRAGK